VIGSCGKWGSGSGTCVVVDADVPGQWLDDPIDRMIGDTVKYAVQVGL
jgi:hypothetical protein